MITKSGKQKVIAIIMLIILTFVCAISCIWFSSDIIQKQLIRLVCTDNAKSVPTNYSEIVENTKLTTLKFDHTLELDIIEPKEFKGELMTVIYFHGGYYIGGGRHNQEPYCRNLAYNGYRVINVDYSLAPEHKFPQQVIDANTAIKFISEKFPNTKFVIAGDSAGAHLSAQLSVLINSVEMQKSIGVSATIPSQKLAGLIGNCGFYKASTVEQTGFFLVGSAMRMLTGDRRYKNSRKTLLLDLVDFAEYFPSTLLVCGDKDPFIVQNLDLQKALIKNKVFCDVYFPTSVKSSLGHEFQSNYKIEESETAMSKTVQFLTKRFS